MLEVSALRGGYGAVEVLRGIDLNIGAGEIVAVLGSNGAGKSTLNNTVCGLVPAFSGRVAFEGRDITRARHTDIVAAGLIQVPEGRRVFPALTIDENLQMGGYTKTKAEARDRRDKVFALFPRLFERRDQIAGYMSGGEQQMLAIGRALMTDPVLLALDEPSLGLAPLIIDRIYQVIVKLRDEMKMTVLLVEQNAQRALDIADYGYILETGRVVLDGSAEKLAANEDVQEFYLGVSNSGRKSLRDVKHYKRRKRWLS